MIRLYIPAEIAPLASDLRVDLSEAQSHYLLQVMRRKSGDKILVFNGRDGEWCGEVHMVSKRLAALHISEQTRQHASFSGPVLSLALIKRARLETIVEKATELGVRRIELLITRLTQADHTRLDRLQAIAIEASEQCERLDVPEIIAPQPMGRWIETTSDHPLIFADEGAVGFKLTPPYVCEDIHTCLMKLGNSAQPRLLIGPEGGFDESERQTLRGLSHVHPVGLGPRIVRADTAAIAGLALIQAVCGDAMRHSV